MWGGRIAKVIKSYFGGSLQWSNIQRGDWLNFTLLSLQILPPLLISNDRSLITFARFSKSGENFPASGTVPFLLRFWVLKLRLNKHECFKMFHGVVVNLCITSFGNCTNPKHQETTAFRHVLPHKRFRRMDGRINLSSLHAQEGQESKISTKAKEKKTQETMEMASLRQDDVTQDMASATHDLSDVRRKCLYKATTTRIRIRWNRLLYFCVNLNLEWCIRFHAFTRIRYCGLQSQLHSGQRCDFTDRISFPVPVL